MQPLYNYALELLKLNKIPLTTWDNSRLVSSYAFGLVEELLEYHEAKVNYESFSSVSLDEVVKEAGDVLAYVVLCLATPIRLNLITEALMVEVRYNKNTGYFHHDVLESAVMLAGDYKRWFREQKQVPIVNIVTAMETVLRDLAPHNITLADVAEANLVKLRDRAARGQLLQGSGGNR